MQEKPNEHNLNELLDANNGYITRRQIDEANISSWFLTDFVRKRGLVKIDKGFYALPSWICDDFLVFQYKYPKFIFSYLSALYLNKLTDSLPSFFEVTGPKNYRPLTNFLGEVVVHTDSRNDVYELGISEVKTNLGYTVRSYDKERTICDIIRNSNKIDSEIYVKALHLYKKNPAKDINTLMQYARKMGIQKKVSDVLTVVLNED